MGRLRSPKINSSAMQIVSASAPRLTITKRAAVMAVSSDGHSPHPSKDVQGPNRYNVGIACSRCRQVGDPPPQLHRCHQVPAGHSRPPPCGPLLAGYPKGSGPRKHGRRGAGVAPAGYVRAGALGSGVGAQTRKLVGSSLIFTCAGCSGVGWTRSSMCK